MGILNITPDSFSDGGSFFSKKEALFRVEEMIKEGVDLIDIGGESTRPGAATVSLDEELARVIPVIESIRARFDVALSIDTSKPKVMFEAVQSGVVLINDVNALLADDALSVAKDAAVPICLMHRQGTPKTMQINPAYPQGIMSSIHQFLTARIEACLTAGISPAHLILDPGFGFGKTSSDNLLLTKNLLSFRTYGFPLLYGASRKSTIGELLNREIHERSAASLGLAVYAALHGASLIRTHDIRATKDALMMIHHVENASDNVDELQVKSEGLSSENASLMDERGVK